MSDVMSRLHLRLLSASLDCPDHAAVQDLTQAHLATRPPPCRTDHKYLLLIDLLSPPQQLFPVDPFRGPSLQSTRFFCHHLQTEEILEAYSDTLEALLKFVEWPPDTPETTSQNWFCHQDTMIQQEVLDIACAGIVAAIQTAADLCIGSYDPLTLRTGWTSKPTVGKNLLSLDKINAYNHESLQTTATYTQSTKTKTNKAFSPALTIHIHVVVTLTKFELNPVLLSSMLAFH